MIKVELIKDCTYHASSHVFDYKKKHTRVKEVSNKVGKILLDSGYFKEVKEEAGQIEDPGEVSQLEQENNEIES